MHPAPAHLARTTALAAALTLAACAGPGGAGPGSAPVGAPTTGEVARHAAREALRAEYTALAARARADDRDVDVARLRVAAGGTVLPHSEASGRIYEALRSGDWDGVAAAAEAVLAVNYADVEAHHFARRAAGSRGDLDAEEHHAWMADELYRALRATGDGRTPDTAMAVISVDEEYYFLGMEGLQRGKQRLGECRGRPCDLLEATDEQGVASTWYFDVSASFGRMQRGLEGPGGEPRQ